MKLQPEYIYDFLLAGRAEATFHNTATGNELHISINRKNYVWNVYAGKEYLGYIRGDVFIKAKEPTLSSQQPAAKFNWVWKHIVAKTLPATMEVLHVGKCGYCKRKLTTAESIERGIGEICLKKLNLV